MPRWRPAPESLLSQADFRRLWSAQMISQLGNQVSALVLPLMAILLLRAGPLQVAMLGAVQVLPFAALGLPAGVWVDRLPRRPILILCDVGSALLLLAIPVAHLAGSLSLLHLYLVASVKGILAVFHDVAYQAYLPSLVERRRLLEGNARLEISRSGAQVTGPGLATGLVNAMGAPTAIIVDALSYFSSALILFRIRTNEPRRPPVDRRASGLRSEIREGVRYVFRQELLLPIALTTAASNLLVGMGGAVYLLFLVRELHLSVGFLGVVFATGNVGFLVGASLASRIPRRLGIGRTICFGAAAGALPLVVVASAPGGRLAIPFLVGAGLVGSFGSVVYGTCQVSLRQAITPERLQGRMNATMKSVIMGATPIGTLLGGVLGGTIGLRPTMMMAAAASCLTTLPVALSPVRRVRELPQGIEPGMN